MNTEFVDILQPPKFLKSGVKKTRDMAYKDGNWLGTFNLWIVQESPIPAILYQQRSPRNVWEPNKLAVATGGHYLAGENIKNGLREVQEELGKRYSFKDLTNLGRRIYVGLDKNKRELRNIVDIFIIKDNSQLETYKLQKNEVSAIYLCPISQLLKVRNNAVYSFTAHGLNSSGKKVRVKVSKNSFPYNWDNYHFKMISIAERFLNGDNNVVY